MERLRIFVFTKSYVLSSSPLRLTLFCIPFSVRLNAYHRLLPRFITLVCVCVFDTVYVIAEPKF